MFNRKKKKKVKKTNLLFPVRDRNSGKFHLINFTMPNEETYHRIHELAASILPSVVARENTSLEYSKALFKVCNTMSNLRIPMVNKRTLNSDVDIMYKMFLVEFNENDDIIIIDTRR